jgi:hypothetical protein
MDAQVNGLKPRFSGYLLGVPLSCWARCVRIGVAALAAQMAGR